MRHDEPYIDDDDIDIAIKFLGELFFAYLHQCDNYLTSIGSELALTDVCVSYERVTFTLSVDSIA